MTFSMPPIVKLAERVLVEIEQAVRRFARFHKYTFGSTLRDRAWEACECAHQAWRDREHQAAWLTKLVHAIDNLKIALQLGSRIKAFASFRQFEMLARLVSDLGKQAGGWNKQLHPKGQNAHARDDGLHVLDVHAALRDGVRRRWFR
jgi:hypothetical protein